MLKLHVELSIQKRNIKFPSKMMFGLGFKDAVVSHMEDLHRFHNSVKNIMLTIILIVLIGLIVSWKFIGFKFILVEWPELELVWTVVPVFILFCIGVPSIIILYQEFPDYDTSFIFTIVGHQWYWSFINENREEVDSFILKKSSFRNLEVDKPIVLPLFTGLRMFVTSADVIHRFALPSLAIKIDAVPGRLKEFYLLPLKLGKYYGQCSEICGANHSYMPISVEIIPKLG